MKSKTIQFIFLVVAGGIIGWKEWTRTNTLVKEEVINTNLHQLTDTGSTTEATSVLWIFIIGTLLTFIISGLQQVPTKLSSPNSV